MTWILSVHSGGGSMVECANPIWAASCGNRAVAEKVEQALMVAISTHPDHYVRQEWWTQIFEVLPIGKYDIPTATPELLAEFIKQGGNSPKGGEQAYDLVKLLAYLTDGEGVPLKGVPLKPEAVSPEDEAAAIASITGANPNV